MSKDLTLIDTSGIVFQEWMFKLPMQQQSVLILACRGPDGIEKFHSCKQVVVRYRASVLKAAYLGRAMRIDEGDDTTFMSLLDFSDTDEWNDIVEYFFNSVDAIPHHYYMHLMHGAEIIGYKHPEYLFRVRWLHFYNLCCHNLHLYPEREETMDLRLNDWNREYWK